MRIFRITLLAVIIVDQIAKFGVLQTGFLPIHYNEGYAFSLSLPEPWHMITLVMFYVLAWWFVFAMQKNSNRTNWDRVGAGMLLGGATSNLVDRMIHSGRVVDFIAVPYFSIFNIADVCITLGVIMLIFAEMRRSYGQSGQSENTVGRG